MSRKERRPWGIRFDSFAADCQVAGFTAQNHVTINDNATWFHGAMDRNSKQLLRDAVRRILEDKQAELEDCISNLVSETEL